MYSTEDSDYQEEISYVNKSMKQYVSDIRDYCGNDPEYLLKTADSENKNFDATYLSQYNRLGKKS